MSYAAGPDSLGVRCTVSWTAASMTTKTRLLPPKQLILPADPTGRIHRGNWVAFHHPSCHVPLRLPRGRHRHHYYSVNRTEDGSGSCSDGNCSAKVSLFDDAETKKSKYIKHLSLLCTAVPPTGRLCNPRDPAAPIM